MSTIQNLFSPGKNEQQDDSNVTLCTPFHKNRPRVTLTANEPSTPSLSSDPLASQTPAAASATINQLNNLLALQQNATTTTNNFQGSGTSAPPDDKAKAIDVSRWSYSDCHWSLQENQANGCRHNPQER
jgi:hypothetical protein